MRHLFTALALCTIAAATLPSTQPPVHPPQAEYTHIIVGAGTTGLVVAGRLTENPNVKVLVIGNGRNASGELYTGAQFWDVNSVPAILEPQAEYGNDYEPAVGAYPGGVYQYELHNKVTAGASAFNTGFSGRAPVTWVEQIGALATDFYNSGWNTAAWETWYKRFEHFITDDGSAPGPTHGTSGPMPLRLYPQEPLTQLITQAVASTVGIPIVTDLDSGTLPGVGTIPRSTNLNAKGQPYRTTTYDGWIAPYWNRQGTGSRNNILDMVELTWVKRIVFCEGTSTEIWSSASHGTPRACGVEYDSPTGHGFAFASVEVIVTAGAVASNVLLQVSGVGDCLYFENLKPVPVQCIYNNPSVGVNVFDNLNIQPAFVLIGALALNTKRSPGNVEYAFFESEESKAKGENQVDVAIAYGMVATLPALALGLTPEELAELELPTLGPNDTFPIYGSGAQQYRGNYLNNQPGTVRIKDADIHTQPNATFNTDPSRLIETLQKLRLSFAALIDYGIVATEITESTAAYPGTTTEEVSALIYASQSFVHDWHTNGGLAMGPVVDGQGRVKGVSSLRVCDMSILPLPIPNHATFTTAMTLGEKCGEQVRDHFASLHH